MKRLRTFLACLVLEFSAPAADNPKTTDSVKPPSLSKEARRITFHVGAVEEIYCHVNDGTLIELPEGEQALVVQGGDAAGKEGKGGTWLFQTSEHNPEARRYVAVKPSRAGSTTTLHIVTNHNIPYSFIVREVSGTPITADVAVQVIPGDDLETKVAQPPTFVSADEANRYKQQAAEALAKLEAERKQTEAQAQVEMNRYRANYAKLQNHHYKYDRLKEPFNMCDVYTDGNMTYVYVDPKRTQAGTPYVEDGTKKEDVPNWSYDAEKGVYTIQGVVKHGYLSFKKDRQEFTKLGGN